MRISTYSLLLIALVGLVSCQRSEPAPLSSLTNTRWMLVAVENRPIALSSYSDTYRSYLRFSAQNTTFEGLGPCNSFTGNYTLGTASGQLTLSPPTAPNTTCPAQSIENAYLSALPRAVRYEIRNRQLQLFDATNSTTPLLEFSAAD